MRILFGVILTLSLGMLAVLYYRRTRDVFSPMCFFVFFQFVKYVPGIAYLENANLINIDDNMAGIVTVYELIAVLFTVIGYEICGQIFNGEYGYKVKKNERTNFKLSSFVVFFCGGLAAAYYIYMNGGLVAIISKPQSIEYSTGTGYVTLLIGLMPIGMYCLMYYIKEKAKGWIFLAVMFVVFLGYNLLMTTRGPIFLALMVLFMCYHYSIKKFYFTNLFQFKFLIVALISVAIIGSMPIFRKGYDRGYTVSEIIEIVGEGSQTISQQFACTSRDGFVYQHFDINNYWWGANFINLLTAPIPRQLYSEKPPVDDGNYLCRLILGYNVVPPEPLYDNIQDSFFSIPLTTQGSMYANFGIIGLIIGALFTGMVYRYSYKILIINKDDILTVALYQLIMERFALTSLSLSQTLKVMILSIIVFKLVCGWQLKKTRLNKLEINDLKKAQLFVISKVI